MTAHNAEKGIMRKPMRLLRRKRKVIKQSPRVKKASTL